MAPEFTEPLSLLQEAQLQVKEASLQLRRQLERQEADPAALGALEQRLADVHRLARKHQVRPETLPEQLRELKAELMALEAGAESAESLRRELDDVFTEYRRLADEMSALRRNAAVALQERISALVRELGMPEGRLLVEVRPDPAREPTSFGFDDVEFLVSANPGMPPRPLARVASGGELSRISLAIQVAATAAKSVATLIFDEVDSGIGGGIAEVVGQKLRILAWDRQVFCVTHLPQVAAQGHHHLLVEKQSRDGATQSGVRVLEGAERTPEIARMLGGVIITEQTLAHAEEMLALANVARSDSA
jgi:DNA repair protein RecN (Recombination protein N)